MHIHSAESDYAMCRPSICPFVHPSHADIVLKLTLYIQIIVVSHCQTSPEVSVHWRRHVFCHFSLTVGTWRHFTTCRWRWVTDNVHDSHICRVSVTYWDVVSSELYCSLSGSAVFDRWNRRKRFLSQSSTVWSSSMPSCCLSVTKLRTTDPQWHSWTLRSRSTTKVAHRSSFLTKICAKNDFHTFVLSDLDLCWPLDLKFAPLVTLV